MAIIVDDTTSTRIYAYLSGYTGTLLSSNWQIGRLGQPTMAPMTTMGSPPYVDAWATGLTPNTTYTISVDFVTTTTPSIPGLEWILKDITTLSEPVVRPRPSNFPNWTSNLTSGQGFDILASEWNSFRNRINQFRYYKYLGNFSYTNVSAGQTVTALEFNQARAAIRDIPGYGTFIPIATQDSGITPNHFVMIRSELNAIP